MSRPRPRPRVDPAQPPMASRPPTLWLARSFASATAAWSLCVHGRPCPRRSRAVVAVALPLSDHVNCCPIRGDRCEPDGAPWRELNAGGWVQVDGLGRGSSGDEFIPYGRSSSSAVFPLSSSTWPPFVLRCWCWRYSLSPSPRWPPLRTGQQVNWCPCRKWRVRRPSGWPGPTTSPRAPHCAFFCRRRYRCVVRWLPCHCVQATSALRFYRCVAYWVAAEQP